jgi:hypothetical protein
VAGDSELIGEEAATEEVLVSEVRAVGSSLEQVLDVAVETVVLRGGSHKNRGGRRWHSQVSRGGWATAEGKSRERAREVEKVESGRCPRAPTRGIRTAGPRGTVAIGGVWSPSHHHARVGGDRRHPFKRPLRLTSGPDSISYFQSFLIAQTLKFELVSFLMSKIHQLLQVDSLKHKEKVYILYQLRNLTGLQVINSGTNSNLNLPRILKECKLSGKI